MYQISVPENIRRILITSKYTKTLRPDFGLSRHIDKRADLFTLLEVKADIIEQIKTYEPRINLNGIDFINEKDKLVCVLNYFEESQAKEIKVIL